MDIWERINQPKVGAGLWVLIGMGYAGNSLWQALETQRTSYYVVALGFLLFGLAVAHQVLVTDPTQRSSRSKRELVLAYALPWLALSIATIGTWQAWA